MSALPQFHRIGIFTKPDCDLTHSLVSELLVFLKDLECEVIFTSSISLAMNDGEWQAEEIDLGIVVGGDGTLLTASKYLARRDTPVVGINLGRVGFLVDIRPHELREELPKILSGQYYKRCRSMIQAEAIRDGESLGEEIALNEVVIHARNDIRMIEYSTHIDGQFVSTQRSDGLVIATPTGSTAYALSAGGPIIHPELETLLLVPISPSTLTLRPLIVPHTSVVSLVIADNRNVSSLLSFDGHNKIALKKEDEIIIKQSPFKLTVLQPESQDYFHGLRTKLHWGQ